MATLGPLVAQALAAGDAVAAEILKDAASELVLAAASVIGRLDMRGDMFPTFLSGGMFRSIPWLAAEVSSRLAGGGAAHSRLPAGCRARRPAPCRWHWPKPPAGPAIPVYVDAVTAPS